MRKVFANGLNLHYQQHGHGPDVILVHGIFSNLSYWLMTIVPKLTQAYRVTVYDLRGHGFSDVARAGYTSGEMAEDLKGLMDGLGIERAHVVGHSFGGTVAMHYAARYSSRVQSLVIGDSAIPALRHHVSIANWAGYGELQTLLDPFEVKLPKNPDSWDLSELLPQLSKLPTFVGLRDGLPRQDRRMRRLADNTTCLADIEAVDDLNEKRIRSISVPTLAVYSDRSPFLAVCRYFEQNLPDCRSYVESTGDHFFPAGSPEALSRLLMEFFTSVAEEKMRCAASEEAADGQ